MPARARLRAWNSKAKLFLRPQSSSYGHTHALTMLGYLQHHSDARDNTRLASDPFTPD